jgi:hypothetical protein
MVNSSEFSRSAFEEISVREIIVNALAWNNIPGEILAAQRSIFEKLGISLRQCLEDKLDHGTWIDSVIAQADADDLVVFCDVDAFPLSRLAFQDAIRHAEAGAVFGLAQTANHLGRPLHLYAGPMFLAFRKSTWRQAGSPSLRPSRQFDVGQCLSEAAGGHDVPIELLRPTVCLIPRWPLGNAGVFGYATFYGQCEFFHLFGARERRYLDLFTAVADDVLQHRKPDFAAYLKLAGAPAYATTPGTPDVT